MQTHNHWRHTNNKHIGSVITMKGFVQKWVLNSRTGQTELEIDKVRSWYPFAHSGFLNLSDTEYTNALAVPSAHRFLLKQIWAFNNTGVVNQLIFYDGSGVSVTMGGIHLLASDTELFDLKDGQVVFHSNVCVSNLASNVLLRVGGLLIKSGPE